VPTPPPKPTPNSTNGTGRDPDGNYVQSGVSISGGSFAYSPAIEAMKGDTLSTAERRQLLADEQGTPFDPAERIFASFDQGRVFHYGEQDAADFRSMLARSGKARSLEQVLTLPLRGAPWKITPAEGDDGQAQLVHDNLGDKLNLIIDQMTSALTFRRAFFETSWTLNDQGQVIYDDVALRPATGCEAGFDPATGRPRGFRQRIVPVAGFWPQAKGPGMTKSQLPGYVIVNPNRAFIYTHGQYRDQINGISDMDVALWCWQTAQKVMFLWFQYLEQQSLPKTIVYGDDDLQAEQRAAKVAGLRSSGVLGIARSGDNVKAFDILESSGKGAEQFHAAITYLESSMVNSALAGFTELASQTTSISSSSTGSYALSADQSEFFLISRQAVADEIADAVRRDLFGPLVVYNYGVKAPVPRLQIGPLSKEASTRSLDLLKAVVVAPNLNVPRDFVDQLTMVVAELCGLDSAQVREAIAQDAEDRKKQAEALAKQMNQDPAVQGAPGAKPASKDQFGPQAGPAVRPTVRPADPTVATPRAVAATADLAGAVDTAYRLVSAQVRDG
jgi:hypothetical protein